MPMAVRAAGMHALSARGTAPQAGQVGLGARFIQKDQFGWIRSRAGAAATPGAPAQCRGGLVRRRSPLKLSTLLDSRWLKKIGIIIKEQERIRCRSLG